MNSLLTLFSLLLTNPVTPAAPPKVKLTVEVQNVKDQKGSVYFALFKDGDSFPSGKPMTGTHVPAKSSTVKTSFDVEPGDYAIAVFHDENGDGKMDKGAFGIPKEPYGFSNNFRPKMSAPKFKDCEFKVGSEAKTIQIAVK